MRQNGIFNINKPQGMTSHDVVNIVRRVTGIRRVGHTGTLDPMATGVLPVCVGAATRITEYLDLDMKKYTCGLLLGKTTDTQDIWGTLTEERSAQDISEKDMIRVLSQFSGVIDQRPPMYSAVRVNGRRLYEYAREGKEVDVKTRRVFIKDLRMLTFDDDRKSAEIQVECSKGTYIRTICQDAGETLGCGAVMTSLVRTASGRFRIEDSVDLSDLKAMSPEEALSLMLPVDFPLVHFGKVTVNAALSRNFADGKHLAMDKCRIEKEPEFSGVSSSLKIKPEYKRAYNVYTQSETGSLFLGVAFYSDKYRKLVADKVFVRGEDIENI